MLASAFGHTRCSSAMKLVDIISGEWMLNRRNGGDVVFNAPSGSASSGSSASLRSRTCSLRIDSGSSTKRRCAADEVWGEHDLPLARRSRSSTCRLRATRPCALPHRVRRRRPHHQIGSAAEPDTSLAAEIRLGVEFSLDWAEPGPWSCGCNDATGRSPHSLRAHLLLRLIRCDVDRRDARQHLSSMTQHPRPDQLLAHASLMIASTLRGPLSTAVTRSCLTMTSSPSKRRDDRERSRWMGRLQRWPRR